MAEYRDRYPEIRAAGADVAALSVDDARRSEALRSELGLPFPILCDPSRQVVRQWDLYNAKEQGGIAVPAVFVIGPDRSVRFRSIDGTRERIVTDAVLAFLRGQGPGAGLPRAKVRAGVGEFFRAIRNAIRRGLRTPEP